MNKYSFGVVLTACSAAALMLTLASNFLAAVATFFLVFGLANILGGTIETVFKYLDARR